MNDMFCNESAHPTNARNVQKSCGEKPYSSEDGGIFRRAIGSIEIYDRKIISRLRFTSHSREPRPKAQRSGIVLDGAFVEIGLRTRHAEMGFDANSDGKAWKAHNFDIPTAGCTVVRRWRLISLSITCRNEGRTYDLHVGWSNFETSYLHECLNAEMLIISSIGFGSDVAPRLRQHVDCAYARQ